MATKLYLPGGEVFLPTGTQPVQDAGWTNSGDIIFNSSMDSVKSNSAFSTFTTSGNGSVQADCLVMLLLTGPLTAGQTVTGSQTVTIQMRCSETSNSNNLFLSWKVGICTKAGAIQKTLVAKKNDGTEVNNGSLQNRTDSTTSAATNYTTVAGDRIFAEIGLEGDPAGSATHDGSIDFGDNSATDLPSDNTTTTQNNPNIVLNDTLRFDREITVNETVTVAESITMLVTRFINVNDTATTSESVNAALLWLINVNETPSVSEFIKPNLVNNIQLVDSGSLLVQKNDDTSFTWLWIYGLGGTTEGEGQKVTVNQPTWVKGIDLYLLKTGTPNDNLLLEIATTSISGTAIAQRAVRGPDITTSAWNSFTFDTPVQLTSGTAYYLRLTRDGSRDTSNYYQWNCSNVAGEQDYSLQSGTWGFSGQNSFSYRIYGTQYMPEVVTTQEATGHNLFIDSYSETNQDSQYNLWIGGGAIEAAQTFVANFGGILDTAVFYMKKSGNPTGTATAQLYQMTGTYGSTSVPYGPVLATSDTINVATDLTGSFRLTNFPFSGANRITLVAGVDYAISVLFNGGDISNEVNVGFDGSSPTHGGDSSTRASVGAVWARQNSIQMPFYLYLPVSNFVVLVNLPTVFDSTTVSEDVTVSVSAPAGDTSISVNDSVTVTENFTELDTDFISVNDSTTVTEFINVTNVWNVNVNDSTTVTESVTMLDTDFINVNDSTTVSESVTMLVTSFININDSSTISEFVNVTQVFNTPVIVDSVTTSESIVILDTDNINVNDSVTTSESVTMLVASFINVSDSVTTSESVTLLVTSFISVNDSVTTSEFVNVTNVWNINVNDSTTTSEFVKLTNEQNINVFDSTTTSEFVKLTNEQNINVNDSATTSESVKILDTDNINVNDSTTVSEFLDVMRNNTRDINVFDSVTTSESVTVFPYFPVNVFDSITVKDTVLKDMVVDSTSSSGLQSNTSLFTFSHTTTSAATLLVVAVQADRVLTAPVIEAVYFNTNGADDLLTEAVEVSGAISNETAWIYYLPLPDIGTYNITVDFQLAVLNAAAAAVAFTNTTTTVNLPDATGTSTPSTSPETVSLTTVTDKSWIVDSLVDLGSVSTLTVGANQTSLQNISNNLAGSFAASYKGPITPPGSSSMSWTSSGVVSAAYVAASFAPAVTITINSDQYVNVNVHSDTVLSEFVQPLVTSFINVNDSTTVSEFINVTKVYNISVFESVTVTEFVQTSLDNYISVFDSTTVSEFININVVSFVNVFDSTTVSESVTILVTSFINVNDSTTVTEFINITNVWNISVFDSTTVTEFIALTDEQNISVFDSTTVTENFTPLDTDFINVSDSITISEFVQLLVTSFISVNDAVTVSEFINATLVFNISVFDSTTVSEFVNATQVDNISVSDSVTVSEAVTMLLINNINVEDDVTTSESVTVIATAAGASSINVEDDVTVSESITISLVSFISVNDTVTVSEFVNATQVYNLSVFDSVTVSEFVNATQVYNVSVNDSVTVSEFINLTKVYNISVFENVVTISENISANQAFYAGTGTNAGGWANPENIVGPPDSSNATSSIDTSGSTGFLEATNFGFSIPSYATIVGIQASWTQAHSGGPGSPGLDGSRLIRAGILESTDDFSYGGPTSLWGGSWTPADINDPGFGVGISWGYSGGGVINFTVDAVQLTVYYAVNGVVVVQVSVSINISDSTTVTDVPTVVATSADERFIIVNDSITVSESISLTLVNLISVFDSVLVISDETIVPWSTNYAGTGAGPWTNPGNITGPPDGNSATSSVDSGSDTGLLQATNFGFNLPSDAIITGILVAWNYTKTGSGGFSVSASRLIKGGVVGSTDEFYGSSTELWGDTWTAADINGSGFGAAISFVSTDTSTANFFVDSITITVYWSPRPVHVEVNSFVFNFDSVTVSEFVNATQVFNVSVNDSTTVTENFAELDTDFVSVNDSITVTEFVNGTQVFNVSVDDSITVTEFVATSLDNFISVFDSTTVTESITVIAESAGASSINVNETVTTDESVTLLVTSFINVNDATTVTEFVATSLDSFISVNDSTTISEFVNVTNVWNINVNDSTTVSELVTILVTGNINVNDTITVTEFVNVTNVWNISVVDTVTVSEFVNITQVWNVNVSDSTTVTESVVMLLTSFIDVNDSVAINELVNLGNNTLISEIESATVTESVSMALDDFISVNDPVTVSEAVTMLLTSDINVNDATTVTESVNVTKVFNVSVNDSTTVSEAVTILVSSFINVSDSTSVSEAVTLISVSFINVNDSTTVTEAITVLLPFFNISVFDSITVTENVTITNVMGISVFDTVSTAEFVQISLTDFISVNDNTTVTENFTPLDTLFISVFDSTTVTEFVSNTTGQAITVNDAITVTESVSVSVPFANIDVSEDVTVTDAVTFQKSIDIDIFEAVTVTEAISFQIFNFISVSESVTVTENFAPSLAEVISVFDTITVNEFVSLALVSTISIFDAVTISESVQTTLANNITVNDSITVSESTSEIIPLGISVFDLISVIDFPAVFAHPYVHHKHKARLLGDILEPRADLPPYRDLKNVGFELKPIGTHRPSRELPTRREHA